MSAWPGPDEYPPGLPDIDASACELLVHLFAECRELGIAIPAELALERPHQQRRACLSLARLIWLARHGSPP